MTNVSVSMMDLKLDENANEGDEDIIFFQAAKSGKLHIVRKKVEKHQRNMKQYVNMKDERNTTALHYAVQFNHIDIVKYLIDNEAKIDIRGEKGATALHYAVQFNHIDIVKYLIDNGAKIDIPGEKCATALHYAVLYNVSQTFRTGNANGNESTGTEDNSECVLKCLLKKSSSNVNCKDDYGSTPLHYAAAKGDDKCVQELIKNSKANVNARDKQRATPLHEAACCQDKHACVTALIDGKAKVNAQNKHGMTPLHKACFQGNPEVVRQLIKKNANIMLKDNEGMTALHYAAMNKEKHCAEIILEAIQQSDGKQTAINDVLEAENTKKATPLHTAALFNHVDVINLLIDNGANKESKDEDGRTPLLVAVAKGNKEATDALLERGALFDVIDGSYKTAMLIAAEENYGNILVFFKKFLDIDKAKFLLNESDRNGNTPLHITAQKGCINVVRLLLTDGAVLNTVNIEKRTALHLAAASGQKKIVDELISRDSDIMKRKDAYLSTALHLASKNGHFGIVEDLLKKGANINERDLYGWTPLDYAASNGWKETAEILIEFHAHIDPTDKAGVTPLHLASKSGHVDMVNLLLNYDADVSLQDSTGRNALDMAIDEGNIECAKAILKRENWITAMRSISVEGGVSTTPLRKMIAKLPDLAEVVFDEYMTCDDPTPGSDEFKVTLNFNLLDEFDSENYAIPSDERKDIILQKLKRKTQHPLMLMVKHGRDTLISHPLVNYYLDNKWRLYGQWLFYFKLIFFLTFLMFLTGYVIMATNSVDRVESNGTLVKCIIKHDDRDRLAFDIFVTFGHFILVLLACVHLLLEFFELVYQRFNYFSDYSNYFEVGMYVSTILYVASDLNFSSGAIAGESCRIWRVNIGAVAIFLAWIDLGFFLRKVPMFGIYIVMLENICLTFLRFSIILCLFIVAFGLAFFTLLHQHWIYSFRTPGLGLLKTVVMMVGEFDYDPGFSFHESNDVDLPAFSYVLFVLFVVVMTILLMNLMIGLAVDDIKEVQKQAKFKQLAMRVKLALNVETSVYRMFQEKFAKLRSSKKASFDSLLKVITVHSSKFSGWRKCSSKSASGKYFLKWKQRTKSSMQQRTNASTKTS